jgi:hypothetical protein
MSPAVTATAAIAADVHATPPVARLRDRSSPSPTPARFITPA